jgi:hypothetical protein
LLGADPHDTTDFITWMLQLVCHDGSPETVPPQARVLRDPYIEKPFVSFYCTRRVGGAVTDTNAIKVLR